MMSLSSRRVLQRGASLLNNVLQDRISGEVGWQQKSYPLGGDGTHALIWVYSKDSGGESGSDRGWVDYLQWTPGGGGGGSSTTDWEQITYTYDPSGRRIAKDVDGVVVRSAGGMEPTLHLHREERRAGLLCRFRRVANAEKHPQVLRA